MRPGRAARKNAAGPGEDAAGPGEDAGGPGEDAGGPRENAGLHWTVKAGLGAGLLAGSWWTLSSERCQRLDVRIGETLRWAGSRRLDRFVTATTDLGSVYAVLGTAATLGVLGRRRAAEDTLGVGLLAWGLSQGTKTGVRRVRPYDEAEGVRRLIAIPTGSSFPSGHATVGAAVATVLVDHARPSVGRAGLALVGAYVPLSRVHVGVHYPTDVLGGAGLGVLLGSVWRGPVAATGRGILHAGGALARRLEPSAVSGVRRPGRGRAPRS